MTNEPEPPPPTGPHYCIILFYFEVNNNYFVATLGSAHYGFSFMQAAVMARQAADRATNSTREELCMYLEAPLEQVENVVAW